MHLTRNIGTTLAVAVAALAGGVAHAQEFNTRLSGFNEVPAAIFSPGTGTLQLNLDRQANRLNFTLTYSGLTSSVTQAHIHFGQRHVAGGIMVFFCSNLGNGPTGTQPCPQGDGTVSGTITADGVVGPSAQNVQAGDFNAVIAALTNDTSYANVHTTNFPAGEIRGEIRSGNRDDNHGNDTSKEHQHN